MSERWIQRAREEQASTEENRFFIYFSQPIDSPDSPTPPDELLSSVANRMVVLSVRKNGLVERCTRRRLHSGLPTDVLIDPSVCGPQTRNEMLGLGARGWWLFDAETVSENPGDARQLAPLVDLNDVPVNDYLLHWTRRCVGHWPDQTETEFIDDLIFGATGSDHRPVATLGRILASQKLIASNELTRDDQPVVSWSAVPVNQLRNLRTYRSHLARWDFELYGIAVKKTALSGFGARPVVYGDEVDWDGMDRSLRPFFQLTRSGSTDWRVEQEWRTLGDMPLSRFHSDQAFVFVPTAADADLVRPISRWPVVVL